MATRITALDHPWGLTGAQEKRLVETPSGRLWAMAFLSGAERAKFFRSEDQGATWSYSSDSDLPVRQGSTIISLFIDGDGFAHVTWMHWDASSQHVHYSRGVPSSSGRRWHWTTVRLTPASGRFGRDADIVVFRQGTGWAVWICWELVEGGHRLSRLSVSSTGTIKVEQTVIDPGNSSGHYPFGGVNFAHNGDGYTPLAAPHVFLTTGSRRNFPGGAVPDVRLHRATYQSGAWTWGNTVLLESATVDETTLLSTWDGSLLLTAWVTTGTKVVKFAEWDGVATTVVRRDPPAVPTTLGAINGLTMAHDPVTDDIFLVIHDITDGDLYWSRLARASGAWSAWAITRARAANPGNNQVQALRHPRFGNIDVLYAEADVMYHHRVLALARKPGVPALRSPANGALLDLNKGGTFDWSYRAAGPGDSQQAWAFRRVLGTAVEWWNAGSKAWSTTQVWNNGSKTETSFPPGVWPVGSYSWTVQTRSTSGVDSDLAPDRTVVSTTAPVVDVGTPEGIVFGISTPTATWTYDSSDAQRDYEVRVVKTSSTIDPANPGPAVWTSGVVTNSLARGVRVEVSLEGDVAYRAYVQVVSVAGLKSEWAYNDFSLSLQPPAGPLVGVSDELEYPSGVPQTRLFVLARSNFMGAEQSRGQNLWESAANATVTAQPTDLALQLEASVKAVAAAAGTVSARNSLTDPPLVPDDVPQPAGPVTFPVVPGESYTALAHLRTDTAARAGRVTVEWYDDDTAAIATTAGIGETIGEQVNLTTTSYTKATLTATAPEGAVAARVRTDFLGAAAAGEVYYAARTSFHPGTEVDWQPGGLSRTQTVRVERSDDDGVTWSTVLDRVKPDLYQQATAVDQTMPLGRPVQYRGFTDVDLGTGAVLTSSTSPTALLSVESPAWVVRDPDDGASQTFAFVIKHNYTDTEQAEVHRPVGRQYPVVDTEGAQSPEGSLEIYVPEHLRERTAELLRRPKALLVQSPAGRVFRARFLARDYASEAARDQVITAQYVEVL